MISASTQRRSIGTVRVLFDAHGHGRPSNATAKLTKGKVRGKTVAMLSSVYRLRVACNLFASLVYAACISFDAGTVMRSFCKR